MEKFVISPPEIKADDVHCGVVLETAKDTQPEEFILNERIREERDLARKREQERRHKEIVSYRSTLSTIV